MKIGASSVESPYRSGTDVSLTIIMPISTVFSSQLQELPHVIDQLDAL